MPADKSTPQTSDAAPVQVTRDLSGAASQIADWPNLSRALGQPVQKLTIQRLAAEFMEQLLRIRLCDAIIRLSQAAMAFVFQSLSTHPRISITIDAVYFLQDCTGTSLLRVSP